MAMTQETTTRNTGRGQDKDNMAQTSGSNKGGSTMAHEEEGREGTVQRRKHAQETSCLGCSMFFFFLSFHFLTTSFLR